MGKGLINGKKWIKRGLQLVLSRVGRQRWSFTNYSLVVLMYHRILEDNHPALNHMQPGMVVTQSTFDMQLGLLKEFFDVIHLREWIERLNAGKKLPRRACAVTFDDGWLDNYEFAFPLLRKHRIPSTIFLVSDYVGTERRFWPERLTSLIHGVVQRKELLSNPRFAWLKDVGVCEKLMTRTPTLKEIDRIIGVAKLLGDKELHQRLDVMESTLGREPDTKTPDLLDWGQVREMVDSGWVQVGSHTRTHRRLGRGGDKNIISEIVDSRRIIEERLNRPADLFCYPNGEISEFADRVVRRQYSAACTTKRGWNGPTGDPHLLRRIGIHQGVSADQHAFIARLSGWI